MKELSIEEKAKRYDEAIERAKAYHNDYTQDIMEDIFHELKESEDEKIRKWIIDDIRYNINNEPLNNSEYKKKAERAIAWLEKQGQTPVDKAELKFNVGDWIIFDENHNSIYQIERIDNYRYYLRHYLGGTLSVHFDNELIRKWTIQDAKDGDVLFTSSTASHETFMFKGIDEKGNAKCYCSYDSEDGFREGKHHFIGSAANCKPATKIQRDLLFQKMREKGYEWDAEKKELKKIIVPIFHIGDTIIKKHNSDIDNFGSFTITDITGEKYWYNDRIICDIKEQDDWELYEPVRQDTTLSEEDEEILYSIINDIEIRSGRITLAELKEFYTKQIDWLKSLKDRVQPLPKKDWSKEDERIIYNIEQFMHLVKNNPQVRNDLRKEAKNWLKSIKDRVQPQPKREWGEEDEEVINLACSILYSNFNENENFDKNQMCIGEIIDKLKSLKERYTWKPAAEQINALRVVVNELKHSDNKYQETIEDLYNDLKKLLE